ncbi:MAG: sulfur carrier protein ThiS [Rhodospirillaceae bacterium]|jgi:thiazole synthase|nr:sulfur carrier protein ThiS [Rhodospirillaceae bacterium]
MLVTINGKIHNFKTSLSLEALLKEFGIDHSKVAIERNLEIVPKSTYDQIIINDGDKLEIVYFIGGGALS